MMASIRTWLLCGLCFATSSQAQEAVKVWEFSPYDVEVWYAFEPNVTASSFAQQQWIAAVESNLARTFRATWNTRFTPLSTDLAGTIVRHFDDFTVETLTENELVLVVSLTSETTKTIRTFDAALESLEHIPCTAAVKELLIQSAQQLDLPADSPTAQLIAKCTVHEQGLEGIKSQLSDASMLAALVSRASLPGLRHAVRPLTTPLPWQSDKLLRERDKLFFMSIGLDGDKTVIRVRELDCPMQFLGPVMSDTASDWDYAPRLATLTFARAFAPVARVEEAESKTAELRLRAGGLILDPHNPAAVAVGDVMHPIVRRDDRNGVPTLLEPLSWTFAAITASDGVKMQANVYTYSGGPGLQGRKNRRTQRVLLKVRPQVAQTDIELLVRGSKIPQSGCFIYRRDLVTEEFELLGRTDWRGRFTIPVPETPGHFLPDEIRVQRMQAQKQAEAQAALALAAAQAQPSAPSDEAAASPPPTTDSAAVIVEPTDAVRFDPNTGTDLDALPLRAPLMLLYIKNGGTTLAKLPMVPGLQSVETAELPDDSRRLKAEAFVSGFQSEILDMIGLRNLLAARIRLHVNSGRIEAAKQVLEEMRRLKNYTEMADELEAIQRRMLDENAGPVPITAKNRIDRMFQTTRDMLQKYMQDNLLNESERVVAAAGQ